MSRKPKNRNPEFKARVALAAVKGDETLDEVFAAGRRLAPDRESEIKSLQAKIGQLTMENDFLRKNFNN